MTLDTQAPHTDKCGPTGKVRYRTRAAALIGLGETQQAAEEGDHRRREERAYHCKQCDGFHLTSKPFDPPPALDRSRT